MVLRAFTLTQTERNSTELSLSAILVRETGLDIDTDDSAIAIRLGTIGCLLSTDFEKAITWLFLAVRPLGFKSVFHL